MALGREWVEVWGAEPLHMGCPARVWGCPPAPEITDLQESRPLSRVARGKEGALYVDDYICSLKPPKKVL